MRLFDSIEFEKKYELIPDEPLSAAQKDELIQICNERIESMEGKEKQPNPKRYIIPELEEFYGKVDTVQLQVLRKFKMKVGTNLSAKGLRGSGIGGERLTSSYVDAPYLMHNLVRGVYHPEGTGFAQAIILNPSSRYLLEIDRKHPTLKINYNFTDSRAHESDKKYLLKCHKIGLPVGILFRLTEYRFRCLGLGKITSIEENNFVIESFLPSHTPEESKKMKDDVLDAYDLISKEPSIAKIPDVNYDELVRDDLGNRFKDNVLRHQVDTERVKYSIDELVGKCERTELSIPDFQRFFVWDKDQISAFFDSILNGFFIGSLLFWEPSDQKIGITAIKGIDKDPLGTQIILDGQQRATSIYYALRSPDYKLGERGGERWFFYIDLNAYLKEEESEKIRSFSKELDPEDQFSKLFFPLNQLEHYNDWIDDWEDFMTEKHPKLDYREKLKPIEKIMHKKLRFMLEEFGVPHVTLKNVALNDVIEIFQRINTSGTKLTVFDLLIAKLSLHKINLKELWEGVEKHHKNVRYYLEKSKNSSQGLLILHAMSLAYTKAGSCKRTDILKIFENMNSNKEDFEKKWEEMVGWTDTAIQLLENQTDDGFGVQNEKFLPSESMIPVLAALLREIDTLIPEKRKDCRKKMRYWYWGSALTNEYSGSSDTKKTADYKAITKWFSDEKTPENISIVRENFPGNMRLQGIDRKNSSDFKAIISLAALKGSKDWTQGLGVTTQIEQKNKKSSIDVDHVFPSSLYKKVDDYNESILNKILLRSNTNIKKSNKKPSVALEEALKKNFGGDQKELLDTLETHFINKDAYEALLSDEYQTFQLEREDEILKEIANRIGTEYKGKLPSPTHTPKGSTFGSKIVLMDAYQQCREEMMLVSSYLSIGDINLIYGIRDDLKVKKIRLLTSKVKADEALRSLFKDFRKNMKESCDIECELRVMSDDVAEEQHARFLADAENCWKCFDYTIAARAKSDSIDPCSKPVEDLETWWDDSYNIIEDWDKFQD